MMMEEYESNKLINGSYYKQGEKDPVSQVTRGEGTVTLHNAQGMFVKKIPYERGKPVVN